MKVQEETARRITEAHSPEYNPQSPSKKLGPWGQDKSMATFNDLEDYYMESLEQDMFWNDDDLEDYYMECLEQDMFGNDDEVGYYEYDDDWSTNAADGAFCPEALDSCWDKSG